MKIGVVRFPGTNCDMDIWLAIETVGGNPEWLWHKDHFDESEYQAVVIPGGFSYGDYLRSGAIAARSPVMNSVRDFVKKDRPVLGICNGFQILCESELLPGALVPNESGRFVDKWVELNVAQQSSAVELPQKFSLPVAHGDGRYYSENVKALREEGHIWLSYSENPNGSVEDIAGVHKGKVMGLMPHPERALFDWMGGESGKSFFESLLG